MYWPTPATARLRDRRQDRRRRVHAGRQVGDCDASLLRTAARPIVALAGDAHEAADALDDEIVARAVGVRAGLSESGDRAVDQPRIDRGERGVIEAVTGQRADLEIFDDDVGLAAEIADDAPAVGRGEVDGDRLLAAIAAEIVSGFGRVAPVRVLQKRRPPAARVVAAARLFDLDDLGAEVGEQLRAPRAGKHARQIDDGKMSERSRHR
jgi:hypothetical protein